MNSLSTQIPPALAASPTPPRVWKFWGTTLWGVFIFGAMFAGQLAVFGYLMLRSSNSLDISSITAIVANGLTISLSVIMGVPAVAGACWIAIRPTRTPYADYLAMRWTDLKNVGLGMVSLFVLVACWDVLSRALGREITAGFMGDVLKSAQGEGALWLLVVAFCIAAPVSEEFAARGFLYRGWSETFLRPAGAIALSSLAWTSLHLQYDWFGFCEVFSIGLLLGYWRYRTGSTWLTILLHGLNNFAATVQTFVLSG